MRAAGEVGFVLHTHLPWLKGHGQWPVGEEWLFQAWATSWLPVTDLLLRLADEGHTDVLTLGVTPMVAAQVDDERLRAEVGSWLASAMWRSWEQAHHHHMGEEVTALHDHHWQRFRGLLDCWERIEARGGLLAVWADLDRRGVIEVLGGPATHPYQPLVDDADLLTAQLEIGLDAHAAWLGRRPTGIWAPECGYRPAGPVGDASVAPTSVDEHGTPTLVRDGASLPGLAEIWAAAGVTHTLVDATTIIRAAGGVEQDWTTRPDPDPLTGDGARIGASDVVAYARDLSVAYHVWSPDAGYPGGDWYLDFHSHGTWGTHPSWRVTSRTTPPGAKAIYEPARAAAAVDVDADHFTQVLRTTLADRPGDLVVAAYDTELFGHWWYEGVAWLEAVLRRVHADPELCTTTLETRRRRHEVERRLDLPESSWGFAKGHATWATPETAPMWARLRQLEARARQVLAAGDGPDEVREQLARELLQAQCSDWPFLVTRGGSPEYALWRFGQHADHVDALCDGLERAPDSHSLVAEARRMRELTSAPHDVRPLLDRLAGARSEARSIGEAPRPAGSITSLDATATDDTPRKDHARMRILLLSWEYPPRVVGGLGRHVAALSRTLAAAGHEVHVVTRDHPDAPAEEWLDDGIHVVRVAEAPPFIPFSDLISWVLAFNNGVQAAAQRICTQYDIDVVHAHDWLVAYAAAALKGTHDLPLVATVHATEYGRHQGWLPGPMNKLIHQVEWWLTYEARRVVTCSRYMREQVNRIFELPADKVDVIPNGVAVQDYALPRPEVDAFRARVCPDARMVLFAGRLEYEKGVQTVLHTLIRLNAEVGPVHFFIAGTGTYSDELRKMVDELGVGDHVTFTGFLEDEELRLHYAAADVAVAPSIYEPFGLVAIEAMACGTPVVVGDTGGLREIVSEGDTGLRVRPDDPDALADALVEVLTDEVLAARLVDAARHVIHERYDWARVADRTLATYVAAIEQERELRGEARTPLRSLLSASDILDLDGLAG